MIISKDLLIKIEEFAQLLFTPEEICKIVELDFYEYEDYFNDKSNVIYKAYFSGIFYAEIQHRQNLIKLANMGSGPAQVMVGDLIKKSKM
jgi:hypothetical protein